MGRKIVWSEKAAKDLANIVVFWDNHNKSTQYSQKLIELISEDLSLLSYFPTIGSKTDFTDVYQHVVDNFKIYYKFSTKSLYVLRLWDSRRNPADLKL